jgi:hypothetical protein
MSNDVSPSTRLRASRSIYARPFGDEIVLLDFGRGEYFALDEVGAHVWRLLESGETLSAIARAICSEYDVSEDKALEDVLALAREMRDRSLVEPL